MHPGLRVIFLCGVVLWFLAMQGLYVARTDRERWACVAMVLAYGGGLSVAFVGWIVSLVIR